MSPWRSDFLTETDSRGHNDYSKYALASYALQKFVETMTLSALLLDLPLGTLSAPYELKLKEITKYNIVWQKIFVGVWGTVLQQFYSMPLPWSSGSLYKLTFLLRLHIKKIRWLKVHNWFSVRYSDTFTSILGSVIYPHSHRSSNHPCESRTRSTEELKDFFDILPPGIPKIPKQRGRYLGFLDSCCCYKGRTCSRGTLEIRQRCLFCLDARRLGSFCTRCVQKTDNSTSQPKYRNCCQIAFKP